MACSNCNTSNCGCSGTYVVSQTCPPACSEVFNTACVVYTGVDITCPDNTTGVTSTVISRNDYLDTALTKIINYFCGRFNSLVIPTTVVESDDAAIIVTEQTLGSVTTYLLSLDPAELPSASQVTAGDNVVVTGDGSAGDPYVVNSHESIVDVTPGTALSVSTSSTGPYENTYTIDIDASLLPTIDLSSLWGFISITPIPNTPNTGDITFQLDVDQVTVETSDDKLAVALTSPGGAPANFLRTFDVTVDDAAMASFVMDTLNQTGGPGSIGLQEGTGIQLQYQSGTNTMIISSTFVDPVKWLTVQDFAGASLDAASTTSTIVLSADATSGLSAVLGGDGNIATFTLENTDKGSDQLTFVDVTCSNVSGTPGGTASAAVNGDVLTLVGGTDIDLTVLNNQITIDNLIDRVYSEIQSDAGDTLQAPNTTSTFTIAGGTGIGTAGDSASQTITITNDGILSVASADANLTVATVAGACTITNAAPNVDQNLWLTINGDIGTTSANNDADTLTISGGSGIDNVTIAGDTITINADVDRDDTEITVAAGVPAPLTHSLIGPTGVLETYVQVRVFAKDAPGSFTIGEDITSDCKLLFPSAGNYSITTSTYAGDIAIVILG